MKTKIKTFVFGLIFTIAILLPSGATAQGMPTYDNTNFISLVKQLVESGKQTAQMIKSVKFLKDAKEAIEKVTRVAESFDAIVQNSLDTVDFMGEILSSDNLKMSDAERAEVLKQKEKESREMVSNIQTKTKRYKDIISFRKMQDKINNRETNY